MVINKAMRILFVCVSLLFSSSVNATWSYPPVNVINNPDEFNYEPKIAIDPQGNAVAVWTMIPEYPIASPPTYFFSVVMSSYYLLSTNTWSTPVVISTNDVTMDTAAIPEVGVDANGNAQAIWVQTYSDFTTIGIYSSTYTFSTHSWGTPVILDSTSLNSSILNQPQIAVAPSGLAGAVWVKFVEDASPPSVIRASTYNGTSWAAAVTASTNSGGDRASEPQVGISNTGIPLAVWSEDNPAGGSFINGALGTLSNTWTVFGSPVSGTLTTNDTNSQPALAVDASGNAKAIWNNFTALSLTSNALANSYYGGTWHTVANLEASGTTAFFSIDPEVGVDSSGNAVAVWLWTDEATTTNVMVSTSPALTNTWTTPKILTTYSLPSYSVKLGDAVGVNANGNAAVVWTQPSESMSGIYDTIASIYTFATSSWSSNTVLSDPTTYSTSNPAVAGVSGVGNPIAMWAADNGVDRQNIQATNFSGVPLPPSNFSGYNIKNHFATQTDYINVLTWTPSPDALVLGYRIYEGNILIKEVPADVHEVLIHNRNKKKAYTYTLVAFNSTGNSTAVTITVPPAKTK